MKREIRTTTGLIIIFAAAVILFGGAYTWANFNSIEYGSYPELSVKSRNKNVNENQNSRTVDEAANWKTYTNDTYGFSFEYPKEWKEVDDGDTKTAQFRSPETQAIVDEIRKKNIATEGPAPDLIVIYYEDLASADENVPKKYASFMDYINDPNHNIDMKETTLNGKTAYEGRENGLYSNYVIVAQVNNHIYKLNFNKEKADQLSEAQKNIISTFQFTQ